MTNRLAAALSLVAVVLAPLPAPAAKPKPGPQTPTAERIVKPMRVAVVQLADPACGETCPRWISAEGDLTSDTPALFRDVLKRTANDALPVFIRSNGGSVEAALAIGRMLRKAGRDIAVTATRFDGCAPGEADCKPKDGVFRGLPVSYATTCLSACSYLIAGAKRRFVSAAASVGVHRIAETQTIFKTQYRVQYKLVDGKKVETSRTEVARTFAGQKKSVPELSARPYDLVRAYLAEMDVSSDLVTLSSWASPEAIHLLTRVEQEGTRLVTERIAGERLIGRPAIGFDEYALPPLRPPAAKRPFDAWLAERLKQKQPLSHAVLQVRLAVGKAGPLFLLVDFVPAADARTVTWRALLMRNGEFVRSDGIKVTLETAAGTMIEPLPGLALLANRAPSGSLPVAEFCRLNAAGAATLTVQPSPQSKRTRPYTARRDALPWADHDLLDHCDPSPPAATQAQAPAR